MVKGIISEEAWDNNPDGWFAIRLRIDGEEVQSRFIERPESSRDQATYTFKGFGPRMFEVAKRPDADINARANDDDNIGIIELELIRARYKGSRVIGEVYGKRRYDDRESYSFDRRMGRNKPKSQSGVLRTKEGEFWRDPYESRGDRPRVRRTAPAEIVNEFVEGSAKAQIDSPENLRLKQVLQPMKIAEHRAFFPKTDWLQEKREYDKNKSRSQKYRMTCDLTHGVNEEWVQELNVKKERSRVAIRSNKTDPEELVSDEDDSDDSEEEGWIPVAWKENGELADAGPNEPESVVDLTSAANPAWDAPITRKDRRHP